MRKVIAGLLCLTFMVMIFPAQVQAENTAKAKFIKNYMSYFDKSLAMQKEMMGNIRSNPITLSVNAEVDEISYTRDDGSKVSNIPIKGSLEAALDLQELKAKAIFNGIYDNDEIAGQVYFSSEGLIVTSKTLAALEQYDLVDVEDLLGQSSETLPEYVLFPIEMDSVDQQFLMQTFQESLTVDNYDAIADFTAQLLNVFPESCFTYSRGVPVFRLQKSILTSAELLHNLKANSESLADSFVAIMQRPAEMSEEEFQYMKEMTKYSMVAMIESIEITDLSSLEEIPINLTEFQISATPVSVTVRIDASFDYVGDRIDLMVDSEQKFARGNVQGQVGKLKGDLDVEVNLDMLDVSGYANLKSQALSDSKSSDQTAAIDMSIYDAYDSMKISGEAIFKTNLVNNPEIIFPSLDSTNCLTALPQVSPSASGQIYDFLEMYEDYPEVWGTDGEIMVFVNGESVWFDEAYPVIRDGHTLLPLRSLADAIYADVTWQPPDTVILDHYTLNDSMYLTINSTTYKIGEEVYTSETAPVIIGGYTYVPIRFIAETFGYEVDWHPATQSVILQD